MTNQAVQLIAVIVFILAGVFIYHFDKHMEKCREKKALEEEALTKLNAGTFIKFFDELKSSMSSVMNYELTYADPYLARHLIYKYIGSKSVVNGKKITCESIKIKFMLKVFHDGRREIHAETETHYGHPQWYGGNMHYNYDIGGGSFYADVNDFDGLWKRIIEHYFSVELTGNNDKIYIDKF